MSRSASTASRQLSLTEELEKLEQSITLTLQEIDANFSKAHRIVTMSILPVVEQYGEHSRNIWEASKFWKQFFESSANCSLSNYEEAASNPDETVDQTEESSLAIDQSTETEHTGADTTETPRPRHHVDDSGLVETEISGSTPLPPATKSIHTHSQFANLGSPYEDLRQELKGDRASHEEEFEIDYTLGSDADDKKDNTEVLSDSDADESALLTTHGRRLPDMSMTPRAPTTTLKFDASIARGGRDPLLHRILDKNYRIQATPLKGRYSPIKGTRGRRGKETEEGPKNSWDSPMSSPDIDAPKLRSAAFMSPIKAARLAGMSGPLMATAGPRTPGVSVQTPMTQKRRDVLASDRQPGDKETGAIPLGRSIAGSPKEQAKGKGKQDNDIGWSSDEEDELYGGFSPPKTLHFALPQSKLMQTPAREASKRIVEDILLTAGAAEAESSEFSPSLVKMNKDVLDDSF